MSDQNCNSFYDESKIWEIILIAEVHLLAQTWTASVMQSVSNLIWSVTPEKSYFCSNSQTSYCLVLHVTVSRFQEVKLCSSECIFSASFKHPHLKQTDAGCSMKVAVLHDAYLLLLLLPGLKGLANLSDYNCFLLLYFTRQRFLNTPVRPLEEAWKHGFTLKIFQLCEPCRQIA